MTEKTQEIQGNGDYRYFLPDDWQEGISSIISVVYPANDMLPRSLLPGDYCVYKSPSGLKLQFFAIAPAENEIIRIVYTVPEKKDNDANQETKTSDS